MLPPPDVWTGRVRAAFARYDEPLLRRAAGKLARPRNHWPVDELIERAVAVFDNPAVVDRRLAEVEAAERRLLAAVGRSRQPRWRLGGLVEVAMALGEADGLKPIFSLLEAGLLVPELPPGNGRLRAFEQWLGLASGADLHVFAHPAVAARARNEDLALPELRAEAPAEPPREADGLEWPLRLSSLWQSVAAGPLRRTQNGTFFKRDLDRLRDDPLLNAAPQDAPAELPDPALLAVALAEAEGIVGETEGELRAGPLPKVWDGGLTPALESLLTSLFTISTWDALDGLRASPTPGTPFPSSYLLVLLLLARLPAEAWADPDALEDWLRERHPYWSAEEARPSRGRRWVATFLLGLLYPLRLVQAAKDGVGAWRVRLTGHGRFVLGVGDEPAAAPAFAQTLLVQPNLEILAYRQGLTPPLVARLTHFASWKGLGAACTLQLTPETVYRGLEAGLTFETILGTLEQHATRAVPMPVVESLRTWAQKRDRITIYPAAALLEFATAEELNEALARGVPAQRLTDRLALVPHEDAIDYKHFRLTGTRDYALPPEKCVTVEADGTTLSIDLVRSDLLLETELARFARPLDRTSANGRRQYRLTAATLAAAREGGLSAAALEAWFGQRVGSPPPPAAKLLLTAPTVPPPVLRRHLVLHVATEEIADGLMQLPATRALIAERLGPTALAVAEDDAERLGAELEAMGVRRGDSP